MNIIAFQFDPTGQNPNNYIQNELHPITEANFSDFYYVIPKYSPFYSDGLSIQFKDTSGNIKEMVLNIDYMLGLPFYDAIRAIGIPVYGAIVFASQYQSGSVSISYRTIGGDWVNDSYSLYNALAQTGFNPLIAKYEQVSFLPSSFPPVSHDQKLNTIMGSNELVNAIENLTTAVAQQTIDIQNQLSVIQSNLEAYVNLQMSTLLSNITGIV